MRLANRTKEVEFFKKMLLGQVPQRILLIEAASGMGKTSLLAEFASLCPAHAKAAVLVAIDLKSAQTGISHIFWRIQDDFGEEYFKNFNAEITGFLRAGIGASGNQIEVSGNQIQGTANHIQVILNAETEETRNMRLSKLQVAFFRDLKAIQKPIVMIFDTFNSASPSVANWIGGDFLAKVAKVEDIRVVIAGQSVPKPTIEWGSLAATHPLYKIDDAEAWYSFSKSRNWDFAKESIELFVRYLNGQPSQILQALESLARGRENE
ncbi:hypothetical protein [Pseudanabaena yagii]|uniref:Orc1-like AAA ATPase domain-containing protein n=1 Tax=Pseudanabaena yagii GIHE-NHR1 TaxID=2722753 RepID=A0ABX1LRS5_9CYAN|nr:hypothetical protein [Pseudanabaena yagii]NMF58835.1 hypothetical protein [Pseudanabaena yagii GIHE-NHR1]